MLRMMWSTTQLLNSTLRPGLPGARCDCRAQSHLNNTPPAPQSHRLVPHTRALHYHGGSKREPHRFQQVRNGHAGAHLDGHAQQPQAVTRDRPAQQRRDTGTSHTPRSRHRQTGQPHGANNPAAPARRCRLPPRDRTLRSSAIVCSEHSFAFGPHGSPLATVLNVQGCG